MVVLSFRRCGIVSVTSRKGKPQNLQQPYITVLVFWGGFVRNCQTTPDIHRFWQVQIFRREASAAVIYWNRRFTFSGSVLCFEHGFARTRTVKYLTCMQLTIRPLYSPPIHSHPPLPLHSPIQAILVALLWHRLSGHTASLTSACSHDLCSKSILYMGCSLCNSLF